MTAKVTVAIGTRPEAIKLAPVVHALRRSDWCDTRVLVTAQHREMVDQVTAFFELEVDADLDLMQPAQTLGDLTSRIVSGMSAHLAADRPDFVLVQGDTTTVFAAALSCFYLGIPTGHVEAGLRSGDKNSPFPEEMNRRLVGRLASLHFPPTARNADNLRAEGIDNDSIFVTGNTVIDALMWAAARVGTASFAPPDEQRLVLVTAHRRENFGAPLERICNAIRRLADRPDVTVLYPIHPNPNVTEQVHRALAEHPSIRLVEPLAYPEFVAAMQASHLILTDSGGIQEEAPSLGKPVLVMRENTERPEGVDAGTAILVGTTEDEIVRRASRLLDDPTELATVSQRANPYGDGHAAGRIVAALRDNLTRTATASSPTPL